MKLKAIPPPLGRIRILGFLRLRIPLPNLISFFCFCFFKIFWMSLAPSLKTCICYVPEMRNFGEFCKAKTNLNFFLSAPESLDRKDIQQWITHIHVINENFITEKWIITSKIHLKKKSKNFLNLLHVRVNNIYKVSASGEFLWRRFHFWTN